MDTHAWRWAATSDANQVTLEMSAAQAKKRKVDYRVCNKTWTAKDFSTQYQRQSCVLHLWYTGRCVKRLQFESPLHDQKWEWNWNFITKSFKRKPFSNGEFTKGVRMNSVAIKGNIRERATLPTYCTRRVEDIAGHSEPQLKKRAAELRLFFSGFGWNWEMRHTPPSYSS